MDDLDRASETEEQFRLQAVRARRPVSPSIAKKRALLAEARAVLADQGAEACQPLLAKLTCENCGDPLSLGDMPDSDSVFCCPECAADWRARDSANRRAGL